jgi:cell wall-associated NlpC family hydrolase
VRASVLAAVACATAALLFLGGCGSSSPRYRSPSRQAKPSSPEPDDEIRFAAKIREEETRGDDRKVNLDSVKKNFAASSRKPERTEKTPAGLNRDKVLIGVVSYLGVPYSYGGSTKNGIDCSAFTAQVYREGAGIDLPRSTTEQFRVGKIVERDSLQFGDLVFFNTTGRKPSHVGVYIEDDLFAHASVSYGVTISSLQSSYYRDRYVGARRMAEE